jgi:hypothetical protein
MIRPRIKTRYLVAIALLLLLFFSGYDYYPLTSKGADIPMETYYIGRFSIKVPPEMKPEMRISKLRYIEIEEMEWPFAKSREEARKDKWESLIKDIQNKPGPDGVEKMILNEKNIQGMGEWAKGAFHYSSYSHRTAMWTILVDTGKQGIVFASDLTVIEKEQERPKVLPNIIEIYNAYRAREPKDAMLSAPGNWFYTRLGAINLPYRSEEKSYARFEGHPLNLKLEIEMETDMLKDIEEQGLMEKLAKVLITRFIPGTGIKALRSGKREVAGLKGEEVLARLTENGKSELSFSWEYRGKDDDGEHPVTLITMESPDGKVDEKMRIWDAMLDSMKPMFERKK